MVRTAELRRRLGITQVRLARIVGVHPITVSKWERGLLRPTSHQQAILAGLGRGKGPVAVVEEVEELTGWLNQGMVDIVEAGAMKLSASNMFRGKVVELREGPVSARVVIEIAPRLRIVSVITSDSVRRLKLRVGGRAVAIIKASEVIVGTL